MRFHHHFLIMISDLKNKTYNIIKQIYMFKKKENENKCFIII